MIVLIRSINVNGIIELAAINSAKAIQVKVKYEFQLFGEIKEKKPKSMSSIELCYQL